MFTVHLAMQLGAAPDPDSLKNSEEFSWNPEHTMHTKMIQVATEFAKAILELK